MTPRRRHRRAVATSVLIVTVLSLLTFETSIDGEASAMLDASNRTEGTA